MQTIKHRIKKIRSSHVGRKILVSLLLIITLGVAGGIWYWNTHKKQIIRDKLESAIRDKSKGLYAIHYDSLDMDEVNGYLSMKNISLVYDSAKYLALAEKTETPPLLFKIHIPEITITGVKTPKALVDKEVVGRKLTILNPTIELFYTNSGKDSARNVPTKDVYEQILGNLDLIKIDTVEIVHANITTRSLKKKLSGAAFTDVNIVLTGVSVDSLSNADTSRILFSKGFDLKCEQIAWTAATNMYAYTIKNVAINSVARDLSIQSVNLIPQMGEEAFARAMKYQSDRFDFELKNIVLKNVDFQELMNEKIIADTLKADNSTMKIYRDIGMPSSNKNLVGTYPSQQVMKIPVALRLGSVIFANTLIQYREKNDITKQVGNIQFANSNIIVSNLTNSPEGIAKNNMCRVDVSSNFMHLTQLHAVIDMPLGDKDGKFMIEGGTGSFDATKINVLSLPMALAKIDRGMIQKLNFHLNGNNYGTKGTVTILYDDLKVSFMEMDENHQLNKKGLLSFIGNIVIKNSNPNKKEQVRVADVDHPRDVTRSFYNLVWKSIFEGISKSIGNKRKMKRP